MTSALDKITARKVGTDAWEVALPRRRASVAHRSGVRPRHVVHAASFDHAIEIGHQIFAREVTAYLMGCTMSLCDLAVHYVDHAEADGIYTPDTACDYRGMVLRYVGPNVTKDADEVTTIDVEVLYAYLLAKGGRDGDGLSIGTVRKLNTVLRATYDFLVREHVVATSPMPGVKLATPPETAARSLSEREWSRVCDALEEALRETPQDEAGIARRSRLFGAWLISRTGVRVGEMCAVRLGDLLLARPAMLVTGSMSERGGLHRKGTKRPAHMRAIELDEETVTGIEEHLAWMATFLPPDALDDDATPLCCGKAGAAIRPRAMSDEFKALCAGCGVVLSRGEACHILRHTHATQLLGDGENPEAVRERLGHTRIETTYRYDHVMPGEGARVARRYGQVARRTRAAGSSR